MQHELANRPLSEISFADIEHLAASQAEEGLGLEFKRELPANSGQRDPWMTSSRKIGSPAKDGLAKEIVAFANAYGGLILVGIDETDDNPPRSTGLAADLIPSVADCAEQLQQALQQIIDPPLPMLEVRGVPRPDGEGEGVLLIRTGPSPRAPHGFRSPPQVYVRRGSRSEPLGMRDIQAMVFETRTRSERIAAQRRDRAEAFAALNTAAAKGELLEPRSDKPLPCDSNTLGFRCTMIPTDDIAFRELPTHVRAKGFFRPGRHDLGTETAPAFGEGSFPFQWSPRAGGVLSEDGGVDGYARWFLGTDGLVEAAGIVNRDHSYPGWFAVTAAQLMAMAECLRRLAGRPDVEYALDCQFLSLGTASVATGSGFSRDRRRLPESAVAVGPFTVGPLTTFIEAFDAIEQEIWHSLGLFRPAPLGLDFEKCLGK